jgi:hypothetical protein
VIAREISLEPDATAQQRAAEELRRLNLRIALVAAVVVMELWGLTAALEAWASGELWALPLLFAAQLLAFATALGIWITTPRVAAAHPALAAIVTPEASASTFVTPQPAPATE